MEVHGDEDLKKFRASFQDPSLRLELVLFLRFREQDFNALLLLLLKVLLLGVCLAKNINSSGKGSVVFFTPGSWYLALLPHQPST